ERDVGQGRELNDLRQVCADRGPPALIHSAAFLECTCGVVPEERKLVIVPQPELIEDADRPPWPPRPRRRVGMRRPWRIYRWVARIGVVDDRNDRKICILWHRGGVKVPERRDTSERF